MVWGEDGEGEGKGEDTYFLGAWLIVDETGERHVIEVLWDVLDSADEGSRKQPSFFLRSRPVKY